MTNVCVNCGAIKWKGESPWMCCPPGEAGHWTLSIYIMERCLSVCVSVCWSVSQKRRVRSRPNLARARRIHSRRKSDCGRLPDFSHDDAISCRSRANISGTTHRISTEFRLPVPNVALTVRTERVVHGVRRWETEEIFVDIRVLKKYAHSRLPVYDRGRTAVFSAPVPRNASNVFEETTFSGTVEMTKVGTGRDFVRYGERIIRVSTACDFQFCSVGLV